MNRTFSQGLSLLALATALSAPGNLQAQDARLVVHASQVLHPVSRYLTGACIEDVNHEIYGGIYSQMIFGESFQEPPPAVAPRGFKEYGGQWRVEGEELHFTGAQGDKLASDLAAFADGEIGVEVFIAEKGCPNIGLVARLAHAGRGTDQFDGYEIALNSEKQTLLLGRHRQNWEFIREISCPVPAGQWVPLSVRLEGRVLDISVAGKSVLRYEDGAEALLMGTVGLRAFQTEARFRNLWVKTGNTKQQLPFVMGSEKPIDVSGQWRSVQIGSAKGSWTFEKNQPFLGGQSQRLTLESGFGSVGVENQGLNRWGLHFVGSKSYQGLVWVRAEANTELWAAMETADGTTVLAEKKLTVKPGDWQRLEFSLTPKANAAKGRFALKLKQPGSVVLGYAFLQPGEWGRFKGLPVRKDVVEGLIDQGITVLRYGGSMINHPEYRWKKMIGPRDRRPPNAGTWYEHSSNSWGILDFMNLCEAAGFEYIPDFNMGESPEDMADFIEYAKGPADSKWGRQRVADGHPQPYRLRYLELGNEERVDEKYAARFELLAKAIWAKDPEITLVVGDFLYNEKIVNPFQFGGSASGITSLVGQQRVLRVAKENNREVWFDLHVNTEGPRPDGSLEGMFSYRDALDKLADGARHRVLVFELNANNHGQRRALANAIAINAAERDGTLPIMTSANCLQPDGQNDNGWDQGLLFLNPAQVWLQPPGYVTRMISRHYQPQLVKCEMAENSGGLDLTAKRSEDGKTLVLQVVNPAETSARVTLQLEGFVPTQPTAEVEELSAGYKVRNTALWPQRVKPGQTHWQHGLKNGVANYEFPPQSFTVMEFK